MHNLEAIIALLFLFLLFGTIFFNINFQKNLFNDFSQKHVSLSTAKHCATLVDFAFANSINELQITNCFGKENIIYTNDLTKNSLIISKIKKKNYLEVEINEHYLQ